MAVRLLPQVLRETMTPAELQALREKHGKFGFRENRIFCVFCLDDDGLDIPYPCDVIKVLDATENLKFNDLKVKVECDHWVTVKKSGQYGYASSVSPEYWTHTYCPKCGEKL